jgi:hypothetical protein
MMKFIFFLQFFSLNGKKWIDDVTLISHDKPISTPRDLSLTRVFAYQSQTIGRWPAGKTLMGELSRRGFKPPYHTASKEASDKMLYF